MSKYSVLIVGAGPTGMELAAELQRHGITFLIIDTRPTHVTTSNAAGVHARTLECWHGRPWLTSIFQKSLKIKGAAINVSDKRLASFDFSTLPHTQYPFILSIPQNQTERILDNHLTLVGVPVIRNTTLMALTEQHDGVHARLKAEHDEIDIVADWVVGCDGYHSTVRELSKIGFDGDDVEDRFLLVDAEIETNYEKDLFHIYLSEKGILAFFMMKESTRIIASIGHDPLFKDVKEPTLDVMSEIIKQRTTLKFKLNNILWQSHFWIHERIAAQFHQGRIFLAGDAAHVHSPAGGQGMNTGIQDAFNLSWKLAYVIKGYAPESLLQTYQQERFPIAQSVVDLTSRMTTVASLKNPLLISIRDWLVPVVAKTNFIQNEAAGRMSELALQYKTNHYIVGRTMGDMSPGDRAFDCVVDQLNKAHLYNLLLDNKHHLFVFDANSDQIKELTFLQKKYPNLFELHCCEANHEMTKVYGFTEFTLCLIRPDQYIAFLDYDLIKFNDYVSVFIN